VKIFYRTIPVLLSTFLLSTLMMPQTAVPPPPQPPNNGGPSPEVTGRVLTALGAPQTPVASPSTHAAGGPSLADTMQFIQDKLGATGILSWATYVHDNEDGREWIVRKSSEISNSKAFPSACVLGFQSKFIIDGETKEDKKAAIPFRDLKDVTVRPMEQPDKEDDSRNGNVTWNYQYDAPIFALRVRNRQYNNVFFLNDEDLANRLAKSMSHAAELCGGGNKDPF
jgi:hypothetical protein